MENQKNQFMKRKILVIDDNENIHEDFRVVLSSNDNKQVDVSKEEEAIFGPVRTFWHFFWPEKKTWSQGPNLFLKRGFERYGHGLSR